MALSRRQLLIAGGLGAVASTASCSSSSGRSAPSKVPSSSPAPTAPAVPGVDESAYSLGVASGDPLPDSVVLWTRLGPDPMNGGGTPQHAVYVQWQIASDEQFTKVVSSGILRVDFDRPDTPAVAAEFCTTSISSDFKEVLESLVKAQLPTAAPQVRHFAGAKRGYTRHTITPATWHCDYRVVADVKHGPSSPVSTESTWVVEAKGKVPQQAWTPTNTGLLPF